MTIPPNGRRLPDGALDGAPDRYDRVAHNHLRRRWLHELRHGLPDAEHPLDRFARVWAPNDDTEGPA